MNVYEREFLLNEKQVKDLAFKERSVSKLATLKAPVNILNIEANHIKRTNLKSHANGIVPLLEHQLWLEAGKLKLNEKNTEFGSVNGLVTQSSQASVDNSNIWRNFKSSCGFNNSLSTLPTAGVSTTMKNMNNISESISLLYPMQIPSPSRLSIEYTLSDYFKENKRRLFKTDKTYDLLLKKYENENALMKYLKLKSDLRNPPLDRLFQSTSMNQITNIDINKSNHERLVNYKQHRSRVISARNYLNNKQTLPTPRTQTGVLTSQHSTHPPPSKISYRQTHPDYERVLLEQHIKGQ